MKYIEPHIHMVSRTTDDYERMALAGCCAITEPAFWAGFDRSSPQGFYDYFRQLTDTEPKRAAQYRIAHYTWLSINPKEAEDVDFAREVLSLIPEFLSKDNVLGIGEIGLNKVSRNEIKIFEEHVELALKYDQLILIHTPHLEDKYKGTAIMLDILKNEPRIKPERVLVDHVEEHTIAGVLDYGFWAGMTLYPTSKCTPQRAVDMIEMYGSERLGMNSAGDWGPSDPLNVPKARLEMRRRGHPETIIQKITYDNPYTFFSQSPKFRLK